MARRKRNLPTTPLTQWLLDYIDEHDTNLTRLSRQCGLSDGALRSLVLFPERKPNIETCIRLSAGTEKPVIEIMAMAGLDGTQVSESMHPDRIELQRIYDNLSLSYRAALLNVARAMSDSNQSSDA
jgi:hypothetical protein